MRWFLISPQAQGKSRKEKWASDFVVFLVGHACGEALMEDSILSVLITHSLNVYC